MELPSLRKSSVFLTMYCSVFVKMPAKLDSFIDLLIPGDSDLTYFWMPFKMDGLFEI